MTGKPSAKQLTTDSWPDSLGQPFRPGDLIAVATISGRSPQMVVAKVERINTTNPNGEPHVFRRYKGYKVEKAIHRTWIGPAFPGSYTEEYLKARENPANWRETEIDRQVPDFDEVPTVTVTATPLLDGRGFRRSDGQRKWNSAERRFETDPTLPKTKAVTYSLPGNIVKLPEGMTEDDVAKVAEGRNFTQ